nr:hypothetical protein [Planctomycetales bacterium]
MQTHALKLVLVTAAVLFYQRPVCGEECLSSDPECACSSCDQIDCAVAGCTRFFRKKWGKATGVDAAMPRKQNLAPHGPGIWNHAGVRAAKASLQYPWHGNYYHMEWGTPVALLVPPTAERSFNMGWGVGNVRLTRNWHQFERPYPGHGAGATGRSFQATPP